jgi:hypothetical protein
MRRAASEFKKKPIPVFSSDSEEEAQQTDAQTNLIIDPYIPQNIGTKQKSMS